MHNYPFEYQGRNIEIKVATGWGDFVFQLWESVECLRPDMLGMTQTEGNLDGAIDRQSKKLALQVISGRISVPHAAK